MRNGGNGGDYDWLLSKIPGWKTYVSIRASFRTFLTYYRMVAAVLVGIPPYLRSNKRYLARYSAMYLFMWALEWSLGLPVEFVILGGGVCCLIIDLYIKFLRPLKPTSALSALKRRAFLKKKILKRQKQYLSLWSTFYVEAGRFVSNPTLRIAKSKAAGLFSYVWVVAFISTFLDFILCPPLIVSLGFIPLNYPDHACFMELMVAGFFIDNGLDFTQSHVINWLASLATFVILISQTTLIEGQALSPYIRAAAKKLFVTFTCVLLLEVSRVSALDFVLINQLNVEPFNAAVYYVLLPSLWWLIYIRLFEYLTKRGSRATAVVFSSLADLNPESGFRRSTTLLRFFINRAPVAVAFSVLCFSYLAIKILSPLILGLA